MPTVSSAEIKTRPTENLNNSAWLFRGLGLADIALRVVDATQENGCMWAIPGGHKLGLKSRFARAREQGTKFETLDSTPWPMDQLEPLEVRRGSLIVLHAFLPHMSYANRSPRSRHAYTLHVMDGNANYPADNWLQRGPEMPLRGFA